MRKQMIENAAYEVATQVRAVEDSIEAALTLVSTALASLVAARGSIVTCHGELVVAKGKVPGLRTVAFGDGDSCPPQEGHVDLRIVA